MLPGFNLSAQPTMNDATRRERAKKASDAAAKRRTAAKKATAADLKKRGRGRAKKGRA
jgi:hypothetical protein